MQRLRDRSQRYTEETAPARFMKARHDHIRKRLFRDDGRDFFA